MLNILFFLKHLNNHSHFEDLVLKICLFCFAGYAFSFLLLIITLFHDES